MLIKSIVILVVALILHEAGHYIAYRFYGYKPTIKFRWWGIEIGDNVIYEMKPKQIYFVAWMGILFGFIPLYAAQSLILIYFFMCMFDFVLIINLLSLPKEQWTKDKYYDVVEWKLEEIREKRKLISS
jgi:hypothetical protein